MRKRYLHWLYIAKNKYNFSIFNYTITSNHIHLLVKENIPGAISRGMQYASGKFAQEFNQRFGRQGAFWTDRYHATIIESGTHLIKCMMYIDLNMVRAGVVLHPSKWHESGYHELTVGKDRYKFLDFKRLSGCTGFDRHWWKSIYPGLLDEELKKKLIRIPDWTQNIAVGNTAFLMSIKSNILKKQVVIKKSADIHSSVMTRR